MKYFKSVSQIGNAVSQYDVTSWDFIFCWIQEISLNSILIKRYIFFMPISIMYHGG